MYKLKAEETLENPARAGAEGARRKPNLSGKRTERAWAVFVRVPAPELS